MRIAYLCSDPDVPLGGSGEASIDVAEMARAFVDLGHDVRVVARRAEAAGIPPRPRLGGFVADVDAFDRDLEDLLRTDADVSATVAWTMAAITGAAAFRHRAREIIDAHRPDLIYERYALFGATGGVLAHELGVPLVLEVNTPLAGEQITRHGLAYPATAMATERVILGRADVVVAASCSLIDWLHGQGVAPERVALVPNGINPDRFRPPHGVERRTGGGPVVGFVGELNPSHDLASLVRAFAALRGEGVRARLLIAGDGPRRPMVEALADELGVLDVTEFTGLVDEAVPRLLRAIDVAVAPYGEENGSSFSPRRLFEYLAAGCPVVAPSIGDIDECVTGAGAGWAYRPGDFDGLTAALRAALADPAEAARRGARGRAHVEACHTWHRNAERVIALVESR